MSRAGSMMFMLVLGVLVAAGAGAPRKEISPTNMFAAWFGPPAEEVPAGTGMGRRGRDAIAAAWRAPPFAESPNASEDIHFTPPPTGSAADAATPTTHHTPTPTHAPRGKRDEGGDATGEEPVEDTDCGPGLRCDGTARPLCCHSDPMFVGSDGQAGDEYNCMSENDLCCKSGVACDRDTRCADMPNDAVCCDVFERDGRPVFTFCPSPDHPQLTICKDSNTCVAGAAALLPAAAMLWLVALCVAAAL